MLTVIFTLLLNSHATMADPALNSRVTQLEFQVRSLESKLWNVESQMRNLESRVSRLENRPPNTPPNNPPSNEPQSADCLLITKSGEFFHSKEATRTEAELSVKAECSKNLNPNDCVGQTRCELSNPYLAGYVCIIPNSKGNPKYFKGKGRTSIEAEFTTRNECVNFGETTKVCSSLAATCNAY